MESKTATIEDIRRAAHEAPMAQVYKDHKGRKFIGVHTDAWWKASRAYADVMLAARGDDQ